MRFSKQPLNTNASQKDWTGRFILLQLALAVSSQALVPVSAAWTLAVPRNNKRSASTWRHQQEQQNSIDYFIVGNSRMMIQAYRYFNKNQKDGRFLSSAPSSSTIASLFASTSASDTSTTLMGDGMLVNQTFTELYGNVLPPWLLQRCAELGWEYPTRIQHEALTAILSNDEKDVILQAETGSGKTLAYLLPGLACIDASRSAVQVLIVVPTRELGLQVGRVAKQLAAASSSMSTTDTDNDKVAISEEAGKEQVDQQKRQDKIMIMNVLQGSQNRRQRAWAWAEPPHLVIGTPQELCDMIQLGGIRRYNSVKCVVVDEVDACLLNNAGSMTSKISSSTLHQLLSKYLSPTFDDGSGAQEPLYFQGGSTIREAASSLPLRSTRPLSRQRQTIFASATIPQPRHFVKQCIQNQWTLREPVHVSLRSGELLLPSTLNHAHIVCASNNKKLASLRRILKKIISASSSSSSQAQAQVKGDAVVVEKKVLIFCDDHRPVEEMSQSLAASLGRSLVWKESYGIDQERGAYHLFATLRYEDSLSKRAAAMNVFSGQVSSTTNPRNNNNRNALVGYDNDSNSSLGSTTATTARLRVLISAGDLGARGLDIDDISHVIHFDLPANADTYAHRAGRTGRMQRSGTVLSIVTAEQEFVLERILNKLNVPVQCIARQQEQEPSQQEPGQEQQEE
ncbi:hypothetical protein ACA910_021279 [Epithemia clementina (nom. ined.)]